MLIAMASAPMVVNDWKSGLLDKDQQLDRTDMTWRFDLANLNKSSSHLIWCDVAEAASKAAVRYGDALRVAANGDQQAATKALVATQSEWRDVLRASATVRVGVRTVRVGEGPEKHTADYIREVELAGWLKDVARRVKKAVRLHLTEAVMTQASGK